MINGIIAILVSIIWTVYWLIRPEFSIQSFGQLIIVISATILFVLLQIYDKLGIRIEIRTEKEKD